MSSKAIENRMDPILYQCVVCELCVISINDLHSHHIEYHSREELSNAIINLGGFNCIRLTSQLSSLPVDHIYCKPTSYDDFESLDAIVTNVQQSTNLTESSSGLPKLDIEDTEEFKMWERELNKNITISQEEFLECVTGLCNDLSKKNFNTYRKKSLRAQSIMKVVDKENIRVSTEERAGMMVSKNSGGVCSLPTDTVNVGAVSVLCNTICGNVSNTSVLRLNDTVNAHGNDEQVTVGADTITAHQS